MQKYFNKNKFNKINGFYQRIKVKTHFKNQKNKPKTEKYIFRNQLIKHGFS